MNDEYGEERGEVMVGAMEGEKDEGLSLFWLPLPREMVGKEVDELF